MKLTEKSVYAYEGSIDEIVDFFYFSILLFKSVRNVLVTLTLTSMSLTHQTEYHFHISFHFTYRFTGFTRVGAGR